MEAKQNSRRYTYEEYKEVEMFSTLKQEYYYAEILAVTGGTLRHGDIIRNMVISLDEQIEKKGGKCRVYSEVKLQVKPEEMYTFPDAMITCDDRDTANEVMVKHPCLLVEVLSKSTQAFDKQEKLSASRKIPTLLYYLIVDQYKPKVEIHSKAGDIWRKDVFTDLESDIYLELLDFVLPMKSIYKRVEFD